MRVIKKLMMVLVLGGVILFVLYYLQNDISLDKVYGLNLQKDSEYEKTISHSGIEGLIRKVNIRKVTELQWRDSEDQKPISYREWKEKVGEIGPFEVKLARKNSEFRMMENGMKFCVLVNSSLYGSIQSSLDQYVMDLTGEGYEVEVYTSSGGNPEDLRSFLQGKYALGLNGCLLVGDLPIAWYEIYMETGWWDNFPFDLYYMDLNGTFEDTTSNGVYDSHTGDVSPEIWVGRLTASPLTFDGADEVSLLQNYFQKNHLYRRGLLSLDHRALIYVDDDWVPWSVEWNFDAGGAYCERTFVNVESTTVDTDYESRLVQNYEFVQICAHSGSNSHSFDNPFGEYTYTTNYEVKTIDPLAFFYNLFACYNSRYVKENYMGGWYIFCDTYGLAAVGCTKSGAMLYFGDFYRPLGEGKAMGEAYCDWFVKRAEGGFEDWEISWFYGMTLLGDPTLALGKKPLCRNILYDDADYFWVWPIPDSYGGDYFNVRFTPAEDCTLFKALFCFDHITGSADARVYVWNSDVTFPTTLLDSMDIPHDSIVLYPDWQVVDLSSKNITFMQDENFHIGYTLIDPSEGDTLAIVSDDGLPVGTEHRSTEYRGGFWGTLYEDWGEDVNFMIRAVVQHGPEPEVIITTITLPDGRIDYYYQQTLELTGGLPPYTWDLTAGNLPDGLSLNSSTGEITGIPSVLDTFNFTLRVTDSNDPSLMDIQHLSIATRTSALPPELHTPIDLAIIYDPTPTFIWSHTAEAEETYTLEYDTDSLFPAPIVYEDLNDTVFTVADTLPLPHLTHYWRVQVDSLNPSGYQSHPFSFSVYICGDANNDYLLDLSDVIWIANYKLKSGPEPIPTILAGDTNGDCLVDLSDVIYLANYKLKSGSAPVPCEDY